MHKELQSLRLDGSSQAGRTSKALDPAYTSVDERSIKDLLAFAKKYSQELRYFTERNEADGDWSGFLGDHDLDQLAAFLANPEPFLAATDDPERFTRPHLVLFLTFLELLQQARAQLNDLTRRHLEFYYREALRLTSQDSVPDRVHALVELADGQGQFLLPAGTLLQAGQDSQGNDLFYRSDRDLLANHATVAAVKSLFAEKQVIGIREARLTPDVLIELFPSNNVLEESPQLDRFFLAMLMMALGDPVPGGKLAPYPGNRTVDAALLTQLDTLLDFVPSVLYMPFSTFRALMQLKNTQAQAYEKKWDQVNKTLQEVARNRLNDRDLQMAWTEPANFEKNFLRALDRTTFDGLFNELPEVQDIYDLYRRREREDVVEFIGASLYMKVEDFSAMMEIVEEINGRWRQVYEILRPAGRKKQRAHPDHELQPPAIRTYEADKFAALVQRTLGTIDYSGIQGARPANFDELHAKIVELETYFHVSAEDFVSIRKTNANPEQAHPWEWEQVYAILEAAHREKALTDRRNVLKTKRETDGFDAMILFALGDPNPDGNLELPDGRKFKLREPNQAKGQDPDYAKGLNPDQDKDYLVEKLFLDPLNFTYITDTHEKGVDATPDEWANVYTILELAQRRKRKMVETPAEIEKWENVYMAPDASQIRVRLGAEGESVTPRWRTFGEGYVLQENGQSRTAPGDVGFAIASPLLDLAEGRRKITLTLAFAEERFDRETVSNAIKDALPFRFLLSTEKKMLPVAGAGMQLRDDSFTIPGAARPYRHALQITLTLDEQVPAIAPLGTGAGIRSDWPVLQIMLADLPREGDAPGGPQKHYRAFQDLTLEKVHLQVEVSGLSKLTLQNETGVLDSKKPFEPFGSAPVVGSSFYLAHPELCSKQLDRLDLAIDWMAAPDNFNTYYLGYLKSEERETDPAGNPETSPIADNTAFKARLKLYDNRSLFDVGDIQLFNADPKSKTEGAAKTNRLSIGRETIVAGYPGYQRDIRPVVATDALDWSRYWQLELLGTDFQHAVYPRVAAACANKIVSGTSADPKLKPYIVNTPYTPKIKRLSVGYMASLEIDPDVIDLALQPDRLYHIEPFGYRDLAGDENGAHAFLPQFENEGELFVGIQALAPPQSLSLLFQMAEGSADPSLEREPVRWSFLDGNLWRSLEEGRLLSDSTNGLLNSGIIEFDLPSVESGALLPSGLYWIRAAIARNSCSVGDTVAIHAQAVSATFEDHGNAPDHLAQPLPAQSISGLAETLPQVRAIQQPFSSFGGKSPEQPGSFYTRVSERLRHKNRALTCWDYEHMVLEAFPGIYKVKCLPVGASEDPRLADVIQVVVIPNIQGKLPFDPFEPRLPADTLLQIEQFLAKHSPAFARLKVKNPSYVRLKARLGVRLRQDDNPGYYKTLLNEELQHYLAPWAYDRSAEIVFGGRISTSLIVNFLEERPYVDYVAGIKLFTSLDGQHFTLYGEPAGDQLEDVSVLAPDAILVSDRSHQIDLITEEGYEQEFFTGINYMKIELDFQIAAG